MTTYTCEYCSYKSVSPEKNKKHIQIRHEGLAKILIKDNKDTRKELVVERHGGVMGYLQCPLCLRNFKQAGMLQKHLNSTYPCCKDVLHFQPLTICDLCADVFDSEEQRQQHYQARHELVTQVKLLNKEGIMHTLEFYRSGGRLGILVCPICSQEFECATSFAHHFHCQQPCCDDILFWLPNSDETYVRLSPTAAFADELSSLSPSPSPSMRHTTPSYSSPSPSPLSSTFSFSSESLPISFGDKQALSSPSTVSLSPVTLSARPTPSCSTSSLSSCTLSDTFSFTSEPVSLPSSPSSFSTSSLSSSSSSSLLFLPKSFSIQYKRFRQAMLLITLTALIYFLQPFLITLYTSHPLWSPVFVFVTTSTCAYVLHIVRSASS